MRTSREQASASRRDTSVWLLRSLGAREVAAASASWAPSHRCPVSDGIFPVADACTCATSTAAASQPRRGSAVPQSEGSCPAGADCWQVRLLWMCMPRGACTFGAAFNRSVAAGAAMGLTSASFSARTLRSSVASSAMAATALELPTAFTARLKMPAHQRLSLLVCHNLASNSHIHSQPSGGFSLTRRWSAKYHTQWVRTASWLSSWLHGNTLPFCKHKGQQGKVGPPAGRRRCSLLSR